MRLIVIDPVVTKSRPYGGNHPSPDTARHGHRAFYGLAERYSLTIISTIKEFVAKWTIGFDQLAERAGGNIPRTASLK